MNIPTDTNKLPAEVRDAMAIAALNAFLNGERVGQAAWDASPGPALEAENARLREALKFYRDNWTIYAVGDEGDGVTDFGRLDGYEAEPNAALKADAGERARTAIARAKGE